MVTPLLTALAVGFGVSTIHGLAHYVVGDRDKFEEAGVGAAGISVFVGATVATYAVLVISGVA